MTEDIRMIIADDHPLFRDGVRALMDSVSGFTVVGEATNGVEAIDLAEQLQPDVILMDINMPGINGIDATRTIRATSPHFRIVVLTMYEDDETAFAAMCAGALGYLLKGANQEELLRAVTAAAHGEAIFGPVIAQRMIQYFNGRKPGIPWQAFPNLTDREREVLDLIARGMKNGAIGEHLYISPKTVRNHISNIFSKLQVADRAEAIANARSAGLGA